MDANVSWQAATEYSRARSPLLPVLRTKCGTRRICRPALLRCCSAHRTTQRSTKRYRPNGSRCYPSLASSLILVLCAFVLGTLGGEVSQCHEKAIPIRSGSFVPLNRSNSRFSRDLLSRLTQK